MDTGGEVLILRLLVFFIIGINPGYLCAGWHSQHIDTGGKVSAFSFSVGGNDHPNITWHRDGSIKFLEFREERSLLVIIDSTTWLRDGDLKLAIGEDLQSRLAYCDENAKQLIYARREASVWTKSIIAQAPKGSLPPCAFISVVPHSSDIAEIVFKDENTGTLKYAKFNGRKWATSNIDAGGQMTFPATTVARDGKPLVAYYDVAGKQLKFAEFAGIRWSTSTIDAGEIGKSIAVGFTNKGIPKVCYFLLNENPALKLAHWSGKGWRNLLPKCATRAKEGAWEKSSLEPPEAGMIGGTIALDKNGESHIAYLNQSNDIVYAQETARGWKTEVLAHADAHSIPQMLIDWNGLPAVLFAKTSGLEYLYFTR